MISPRPVFTVTTPADVDERRFIDLAVIRSLSGVSTETMDDAALGATLDAVLAAMARSCRLAASRGYPITLAREVVKATWVDTTGVSYGYPTYGRGSQLLLPWRAPITSIEITEDGIELVEDVDFRLLGGGVVERLSSGSSSVWPFGAIVVDYTAGWLLDDDVYPVPSDIVMMVADQVRMSVSRSTTDLSLRSEDIPNVWSGTYNSPGGDAVDSSGLLRPLYDALASYRAPPSVA
jgi:hypothetical protein